MCGRYTLRAKPKAIAEEFDLPEVSPLEPRFNIAPNHPVAWVRFDSNEGTWRLDRLRRSLVPFWTDDLSLHFPRKPIGERAPADEISPAHLRGRKLPQPWSVR